ncbi:MAG: hypothetical protein Q4D38_12660 [Planctomycetia bacterium]|nr:hypothetical protein [Planctomycetia bacterium]
MEIVLDVIILFADKVVYFFNSFRNFSRQLNQADQLPEAAKIWLYAKWGKQLKTTNGSSKNRISKLLVSVLTTKRNKSKILIRGLKDNRKMAFEISETCETNDIPDEFKEIQANTTHHFYVNCNEQHVLEQ